MFCGEPWCVSEMGNNMEVMTVPHCLNLGDMGIIVESETIIYNKIKLNLCRLSTNLCCCHKSCNLLSCNGENKTIFKLVHKMAHAFTIKTVLNWQKHFFTTCRFTTFGDDIWIYLCWMIWCKKAGLWLHICYDLL